MEPPPKFNLSSQSHNLDRSSLQSTYLWSREYSGGNVVAANPVYLENTPHQPTMFERLLHTVARKAHDKRDNMDELKIRQWQEDDKNVREGTCSFQVQYLGSAEVLHSKGVQLCEQVVKNLKHAESQSSKKKDGHVGNRWATMTISGEKISVHDDDTQNVIVESTIKSVSFCSAHRRYEKCFAYICRLAPGEHRWVCHAFSAITASGERLNHAVSCAFEASRENTSQPANNNNKQDDGHKSSAAATGAARHQEAVAITTDASKLPDPSIARPRPSIESQKGHPELQGHVALEMDDMH